VLQEADKRKVGEFLKGVELKLLLFKDENCQFCDVIEALLDDLQQVSNVTFEVKAMDDPLAKAYGLVKAPVILPEKHPNLRYFGIPSGHEFMPFLATLKAAATGKLDLPADFQARVKNFNRPTDIKVFITPTCPYCSDPVVVAHQMAMLNPKITSTMVESMEFPELAQQFQVSAVPRIVVNDSVVAEGSISPEMMLDLIRQAHDE